MSLGIKVIIGVITGTLVGILFKTNPIILGISTETLGDLGMLVIRLLKTLAIPLIFLAIVESIPQTSISKKQILKLIGICLFNVTVAMSIGLLIMNIFNPGKYWAIHFPNIIHNLKGNAVPLVNEQKITFLGALSGFIPESIVGPFLNGSVIAVVILAIFMGLSLRYFLNTPNEQKQSFETLFNLVQALYQMTVKCLEWVIEAVPYAIFGMVAQTIGKSGIAVFKMIWLFPVVMILGLAIHSLIYYPLLAWITSKKSPRQFFKFGNDAILTGFSANSSLAAVPVTLECLKKMEVSDQSSRLAACVGTNLNNDGVALYEAMAVIFILQAFGIPLDLSLQIGIVFTAVLAGWGIAGIPEAGLVMLPIVLSSTPIPSEWIAAIIPLIVPVDWIIARCRSAVNVMSDMTVAIVIDGKK